MALTFDPGKPLKTRGGSSGSKLCGTTEASPLQGFATDTTEFCHSQLNVMARNAELSEYIFGAPVRVNGRTVARPCLAR